MRLLAGLFAYVFLMIMGSLFLYGAGEIRRQTKPREGNSHICSISPAPRQLILPMTLLRPSRHFLARAGLAAIIDKKLSSGSRYFLRLF
jgi:hypothetical protein